MSVLRARCPRCRTLTAVAIGSAYECHACGGEFAAGLVRVPRAWGRGGEAMAAAAQLPLPFPEAAVVDEESLAEQTAVLAEALPRRPLVLGGCCCAHVGAVEGLAARHRGLAVVWIDAHGDLNTPGSSPTGNPWGMALRMLLDGGALPAGRCALVGARSLDPAEAEFLEHGGLRTGTGGVAAALDGAAAVYVAIDLDALDPGEGVSVFLPVPGGLSLADTERLLAEIAASCPLAGAGFTGLAPDPRNLEPLRRLAVAVGLG